jgi:hypothetical protein
MTKSERIICALVNAAAGHSAEHVAEWNRTSVATERDSRKCAIEALSARNITGAVVMALDNGVFDFIDVRCASSAPTVEKHSVIARWNERIKGLSLVGSDPKWWQEIRYGTFRRP